MKEAISLWMSFRTLVERVSMLSVMFVAKLFSHLVGSRTDNLFYKFKNYVSPETKYSYLLKCILFEVNM